MQPRAADAILLNITRAPQRPVSYPPAVRGYESGRCTVVMMTGMPRAARMEHYFIETSIVVVCAPLAM